MASSAAVNALIRVAKPAFSSPEERISFAVHAFVMSSGYKLVAVGADADTFSGGADAAEVDAEGFSTGAYCGFRYVPESGEGPGILVKCMPMGDSLLVNAVPMAEGAGHDATKQVTTAELSMKSHVDMDAPTAVASFRDLDALVECCKPLLPKGSPGEAGKAQSARNDKDTAATTTSRDARAQSRTRPPEEDPLRADPLRVGPPGGMRGGVPGPMRGGIPPGMHGGAPGGLGGMGGMGGMHMGPRDPMFMGGAVGPMGRGGLGGMGGMGMGMGGTAVPPGARYDPIHGPPGMPGSHPDDYRMDGFHDAGPPPGRNPGFDPYM